MLPLGANLGSGGKGKKKKDGTKGNIRKILIACNHEIVKYFTIKNCINKFMPLNFKT